MSMFIVPVPQFDADMTVAAYWLYSHNSERMLGVKDNFQKLDDSFSHPGLEIVESIGIDPFTGEKPLFVSFSRMQLMTKYPERVKIDPKMLVCAVSVESVSDEEIVSCIHALHEDGYRFALDGFPENIDAPVMEDIEYIVLDYTDSRFGAAYEEMSRRMSDKKKVIYNIPDMETFETLRKDRNAHFAGNFYNHPITKDSTQINPIKINALHLYNYINQEDFDFEDIVKTIERDPYLSVSLLKFLNSNASGLSRQVESIKQAVAILGQNSIRRWATIALSTTLGEDRPNEITKLALVRAKFAEDIAVAFDLGVFQAPLFMMGLFSLLDVMLEKPMEEALNEVAVNKMVKTALLEGTGPLAPVMELIRAYELADWDTVSILMVQHQTDMDHVSQAYLDALIWYRELLQSIDDSLEDSEPEEEATIQ